MNCCTIIVTYNSDRSIHKVMTGLLNQTRPVDRIIIVDNASKDPSYLFSYRENPNVRLYLQETNHGFCKGNNIGMAAAENMDYILFLNPDAFLLPDFIEKALAFMEDPANAHVGVLTPTLLGYDIEKDQPNGRYDSMGVFRNWYGRWFDRNQGVLCDAYDSSHHTVQKVPAICGALMFCRKKALDQIKIDRDQVFDNRFFMYKEDIDLSLRLRQARWDLVLIPSIYAYHCRGWNPDRKKMPRLLRLYAARNEVWMHLRNRSIYTLTSALNYLLVKMFDL